MNSFTPPPSPERASSAARHRIAARGLLRWLAGGAAALALLAPASAAYLLPQYTGTFAAGSGADAAFHQIQNNWSGSAVPTDGTTIGVGSRTVGSFTWGTGLWGQVDWQAVQQAAAGQGSAATGALVNTFAGAVSAVSHANARYNQCYGGAPLGTVALVPFFTASAPVIEPCSDAEAGNPEQHNWTARYSGYIRITDPGEYNFGVLADDGFFFRLIGAGSEQVIGRDFLNPPDRRIGFGENLSLTAGLYGFELGAWNRLGAGVVDLRWASGCAVGAASCNWTVLPTENLLTTAQVPEPPVAWLVMAGLIGLMGIRQARAGARLPRWRPSIWCRRAQA